MNRPEPKYKDRAYHLADGVVEIITSDYGYLANEWQYLSTNGLWYDESELSKVPKLKTQTCPQCKAEFNLRWEYDNGKRETLIVRGCPSGGIYDISISCPHCDYEEAL
jgi:hypothetical protein